MKLLTINDYSIVQPYLKLANYEGYNSNFHTMMMWKHEYHILYEAHDHFLIMLHNYKGYLFWAMPFCEPQYYQEAMDYMIHYSREHHFEFVIECATEEFVHTIIKCHENKYLCARTSFNDDYIYDRQTLQNLTGKKMQKRRNHYNAFIKNYEYYYRELDGVKDFDIILKCLMQWESNKGTLSESITSEIYGIMSLLSYQSQLNYKIGGIFINDILEAFIIASQLNHSTIQIHVEKANKDIRGLYPAILKEMLEHHFPNEQFINREEDMGLENLRKAKRALNPVKMIHKYRIELKDITITKANSKDQNQICKLWKTCFKDENNDTTQYYFRHHFSLENTYVLKNNKKVISSVQIHPMYIMINHKPKKCYFILGVCTHPQYQKQGFMKLLFEHVLEIYKDETLYLQAYIPEIYKSFGFFVSHYHQKIKLDKSTLINDDSLQEVFDYHLMETYYNQFTKRYNYFKKRDNNDFYLLIKRSHSFKDNIIIFKDYGYMIYHEDANQIYVSELIYVDLEALKHMLNYFYDENKEVYIECDLKAKIKGETTHIVTMMSNKLDHDTFDSDYYINEIY